jgi:hypothetical protein
MAPPRARTWTRPRADAGGTGAGPVLAPLVDRRGAATGRGEASRLIYRARQHRMHQGIRRNSSSWGDYRDLMVRAHIQLNVRSGTISTGPQGCASAPPTITQPPPT